MGKDRDNGVSADHVVESGQAERDGCDEMHAELSRVFVDIHNSPEIRAVITGEAPPSAQAATSD